MKYRIHISDEALADDRKFLLYIAEDQQSPETAHRWWDKALAEVQSLEIFPHRYPAAQESVQSQFELRCLTVDRCLFNYHVDEAERNVVVVRFRHGSQLPEPLE